MEKDNIISFKDLYSNYLSANSDQVHLVAHGHHPWPDKTFEGHLAAWDHGAKHSIDKWNQGLTQQWQDYQNNITELLNLEDSERIAIGPHLQEFNQRLLSCFYGKKFKVLTTDSEFFSMDYLLSGHEDRGLCEVERVAVHPIEDFEERFLTAAKKFDGDLIFFSHVFYNSGFRVSDLLIDELVSQVSDDIMLAIDGYHAFMAVPLDLSRWKKKAFYLAGGYKYAQAGEGNCFLYVPEDGAKWDPLYKGWFGNPYPLSGEKALRYQGSTLDPSGVMRFNKVCELYKEKSLSVASIRKYIEDLQSYFLENCKDLPLGELAAKAMESRGNFLSFITPQAEKYSKDLEKFGLRTNFRAHYWRLGFGMHLDKTDIQKALTILQTYFN